MCILRFVLAVLLVTAATLSYAGHYELQKLPGVKNPTGGELAYTNVSHYPYMDGQGSTGGYGAKKLDDPNFVFCTGTITAKFVWVRNQITDPNNPNATIPDSLDEPPAEVIAEETCNAYFMEYYMIGFSGAGVCNNGLDFEPIYYLDGYYMYLDEDQRVQLGWYLYGSSAGTRYTKKAGTPTITLTCDPYSQCITTMGMCSAGVSYTARIIVPTITLTGVTRFRSADAVPVDSVKFLTGQQVKATLSLDSSALKIAPNSYMWDFDGKLFDPFKDYTFGSVGERKPILLADQKKQEFLFYSNKSGGTKITCDVSLILPSNSTWVDDSKPAGSAPGMIAKSVSIDSERPEFKQAWDIQTGVVAKGASAFGFGGASGHPNGQDWSGVDYKMPTDFGRVGQGCFCQLITADRHKYRTVTSTGKYVHFIKETTNQQQAVDMMLPYYYGAVWNIKDSTGTGYDSPSQEYGISPDDGFTDQWTKSTAADSFETWAMFRPPAKDGMKTTWIPIASYTWKWGAVATNGQNGWSLTGDYGTILQLPKENFVHPSWTLVSPSPFNFKGVQP